MHPETKYEVKLNDHLSANLLTTPGGKQSCSLSPILSNMYQNDIHEIFDMKCVPVKEGGVDLDILSWADDLLLMSTSKAGLQFCLNTLISYCKQWGLVIISQQTKTIVLTKHKFT